ncbi:MAG TPA: hypothetical protein VFK89_02885 [Actinomycetota bacterium]|nr:hypothetical protein [Actinomycetota bacterium]
MGEQPDRSKGTRILFGIVSWTGVALFALGSFGSFWSLFTFIQIRTGWGLDPFERCCMDLAKASLGGLLASMFFVLVGSAVVLLLHPIRAALARAAGRRPARWLRWIAFVLTVYAVGVFTLATVLAGMATELEGFATGIVSYCMLVGVGMLAAAWGFKRASEVG